MRARVERKRPGQDDGTNEELPGTAGEGGELRRRPQRGAPLSGWEQSERMQLLHQRWPISVKGGQAV